MAYEGPGVPVGKPAADTAAPDVPELHRETSGKPRYWRWADLMRRAFDIDVLACPRCGGRMRLIATIEDPRVIRRILAHLGLPTQGSDPRPSRPPPPGRSADLFPVLRHASLTRAAGPSAQPLGRALSTGPDGPARSVPTGSTGLPTRTRMPQPSLHFRLDSRFVRAIASAL